jgi:methionine sulfoxide reductase heme-binding subunit
MAVAANVLVTSRAIWYAMRASGVVSLVLLTGVTLLGVATVGRWRPGNQPGFVTPALHRSIALLSVAFVALHVITAVADPYAGTGVSAVVIPFVAALKPFWAGLGAVSLDLVAALIVTSLARRHLGPRTWRGIHWLAYLAWPLAVAHALGMGSDVGSVWLAALAGTCVAAVVAAAGFRLLQPGGKRLEPQEAPA